MKKSLLFIIISMAFLFACADAIAQDTNYREKASHLYATAEFNLTGSDYQGWGKPDFGSYGFTVSPGYRFNPHWAVFVPVNADVLLLNRQSTKNYVEQGTLGLGGTPYVGIGCSYLSPYGNVDSDKVMLEINFGFTIF